PVEVGGGEAGDLGGELDRARVGVAPVGVEGELLHLLVRPTADLVAVRVADLDGEEAREPVEVAAALIVLQVAAVTPDDDRRLVSGHPREREPGVLLRERAEVGLSGHARIVDRAATWVAAPANVGGTADAGSCCALLPSKEANSKTEGSCENDEEGQGL